MNKAQFVVDKNRCTGCGMCVKVCSGGVLSMGEDGRVQIEDFQEFGWSGCWKCEHCLAVCPTGAISIFGHCPKDSIPPVQADEASPVMDALIANRHSCRRYQDRSVDPGMIWDTIRIATKPMTEQYVLGEMLKILIEKDTDLHVELTQGVGGGTSNIQPAMESGEFDLYPEYTGTVWNMVMKEEGMYTEGLFDDLQAFYNDELSMEWTGMYGFNNTYGLVVRREIAEQYDLKTYSDRARISEQLVFGAEYDFFEREDGYDALCDTYGFHFKETMDLDIGLKYQAIDQGQIDVMVIFTTDGQLSASDVTVLEDDKQFYPSYLCGNVVRSEVLQEHPELEQIFEQVTGVISDRDMTSMNYQVEAEGKEPEDVAEEFLESRGLL